MVTSLPSIDLVGNQAFVKTSVTRIIFSTFVNTYIPNAMLRFDDDNGIPRYTRYSVFQKLLILAPYVINVRRSVSGVTS